MTQTYKLRVAYSQAFSPGYALEILGALSSFLDKWNERHGTHYTWKEVIAYASKNGGHPQPSRGELERDIREPALEREEQEGPPDPLPG
jgi:hypothetical protein